MGFKCPHSYLVVIMLIINSNFGQVQAYGYFSFGPSDTTAIDGTSVTLRCKTLHRWQIRVSVNWYLNSSYINTRRSKYKTTRTSTGVRSLTISDVRKADEGNYRCVIHSRSSGAGYLRVLQIHEPSFVKEPASVQLPETKTGIIDCEVENINSSYMEIHWVKRNTLITQTMGPNTASRPERNSRYSVITDSKDGRYSLRIEDVTRYDTGYYQCRIKLIGNGYILYSKVAKLSVIYPPESQYPWCTLVSQKRFFKDGEEIITDCTTRGGNAPVMLRWSKGDELWNSTRSEYRHRYNYMYSRRKWTLSADDNGAFVTCELLGDAILTDRNCTVGPLNVHFQPIVSLYPKTTNVRHGKPTTLTCSVRANPEVNEYIWLVNDEVIINIYTQFEIKQVQGGSSLTIKNSTPQMNGMNLTIVCKVRNSRNFITDKATVFLQKVSETETSTPISTAFPSQSSVRRVGFANHPAFARPVTILGSVVTIKTGSVAKEIGATSSHLSMVLSLLVVVFTVICLVIAVYVVYRRRRYGRHISDGMHSLQSLVLMNRIAIENDYVNHANGSTSNEAVYYNSNLDDRVTIRTANSFFPTLIGPEEALDSSGGARAQNNCNPTLEQMTVNRANDGQLERGAASALYENLPFQRQKSALDDNVNGRHKESGHSLNVEGLVYADLELFQNTEQSRSERYIHRQDDPVIYAEVQHQHIQ